MSVNADDCFRDGFLNIFTIEIRRIIRGYLRCGYPIQDDMDRSKHLGFHLIPELASLCSGYLISREHFWRTELIYPDHAGKIIVSKQGRRVEFFRSYHNDFYPTIFGHYTIGDGASPSWKLHISGNTPTATIYIGTISKHFEVANTDISEHSGCFHIYEVSGHEFSTTFSIEVNVVNRSIKIENEVPKHWRRPIITIPDGINPLDLLPYVAIGYTAVACQPMNLAIEFVQ